MAANTAANMAGKKFFSSDLLGLVMAFIILAMMGFVTVRTEEERRASGLLVRHTLQVQKTLANLYGSLQRTESRERGFLLTQDARFLDNYIAIRDGLETDLRALEKLTADNPQQISKIAEFRPLLMERLDLLKDKIDMANAGRAEDAITIVRGGRGVELMDRIEKLIADMVADEDALYERRFAQNEAATLALKQALAALAIVATAVAGFAIYSSHRQLGELQASRDSLSLAYNALIEETQRRESLQAQLRQSQKLEAIGQLTGGIAHDFNNMLAVFVASLNILRRKLQRKDDDYETVIVQALESADKASTLIKRLLAFARIQPLSPQAIDANRLVSGMSTILRHTLGSGVRLETVLAGGLWTTRVDANQLENAILNLAVNARDAMLPDGGKLTIETANCWLDEQYERDNPGALAGQYVLISVSDTGCGMAPDVIARAFDPFFTTKPAGKGTGLGLSQAHGFVKQSGGHIKIYSEPGCGTTVKIYLPRHPGSEIAGASHQPDSTLPTGAPEDVVLVVEDDDAARHVTVQSVRELGYTVIEADCGRAAIDIIRERNEIKLLLTDIVMPEMDGARLAREATFRRHDLRVLFVTGFSRNAVMHNGLLPPHVHLLAKPFTIEQLARKMRAALDAPALHG